MKHEEARPGEDSGAGQRITGGQGPCGDPTAWHRHDLHRRAAAARRLAILPDGCADPWPHHWAPLSVESARAAWHHLHHHGLLSDVIEAVLVGAGGRDDA